MIPRAGKWRVWPVTAMLFCALSPSAHASISSAPAARLENQKLPELPSALQALDQRETESACVAFCRTVELSLKGDGFFGGGGSVVSQDAWGNYRFPAETDASKNRFGFTGYELDKETGLYNAKARYFDPQLGRFLTQDSVLGNADLPPSLHRYAYGWNRPTFYLDPSGHEVRPTGVDPTRLTVDEFGHWHVGAVTAIETETVEVKAYSSRGSAVAAELDVNLAQPARRLANRGLGMARAAGGGAQILMGAGGLAAPEPTMVTKVAGGVAIAHGIDDIQSGVRQAFTGEVKESLTGTTIRRVAERAGASPEAAGWISAGGELAITAGASGLAARGIPGPQRTSFGPFEPDVAPPPPRPTWQAAEADAAADLREFGFKQQKSYLGKEEVPYGTQGSVRPDLASENLKLSVDVKDYNVTSPQGRFRLVKEIEQQVKARASELPEGMRQGVIIDMRGQDVSDKLIERMIDRIVRRSEGLVERDNIVVRKN